MWEEEGRGGGGEGGGGLGRGTAYAGTIYVNAAKVAPLSLKNVHGRKQEFTRLTVDPVRMGNSGVRGGLITQDECGCTAPDYRSHHFSVVQEGNLPGAHQGTASPGVHGQSVIPGALLSQFTPIVRIDALQLVVPTDGGTIVHCVYHSHACPRHPPAATSPAPATSMLDEPFRSIRAWRRDRDTGRVSMPCPETPAINPATHAATAPFIVVG